MGSVLSGYLSPSPLTLSPFSGFLSTQPFCLMTLAASSRWVEMLGRTIRTKHC
jgi:hypothetical protein